MKSIASAVLIVAAISSVAVAQQQPAPEQALAQKLMAEINTGLQCTAAAITLQQQLIAAQAELKELKAKLPKPEDEGEKKP